MLSAHIATQLIATYGYLGLFAAVFVAAVGIGAPIPVTALLLTVGALSASRGGPSVAALSLAGIAGATGGHMVDYWFGRLGNRLARSWLARAQRRPGVHSVLERVLRLRGGRALLLFVSRFVLTPIASPVSMLAGVTRLGFGVCLGLEVCGTAIYVLGNLTLGRIFGATLLAQGGALPAFWVVVAVATLAPVALIRLALYIVTRTRIGAATAPAPEAATAAAARSARATSIGR